ncbi:lipase, partial [Enterococcus lactis]|nr:lipase [Enterococcus lactis]
MRCNFSLHIKSQGGKVMTDRISLEKEAIAFSDANAPHPRIYE